MPDCSTTLCAFESAVQAHGAWATITRYFAEIDSACVEVNVKDDQQVDTYYYQLLPVAAHDVSTLFGTK